MFKRSIASLVCLIFITSCYQPVYAQDFSINQLPVPGTMVGISRPFSPLSLRGLIVNPRKPLEFQFIVDTGHGPQDTASVKEQANQLVKYFLAGLTIPEGDLWVNLSPYEKNRMVPEALGETDLGRDLLAQDYILKQLTASLIYPEKDLGKEFWSRVYSKAQEQFGTTDIPVNTFNKVWILPDQAQIFENGNAAYVTKSSLKIMLDEDYLAKQKHQATKAASISSQIVREIVLPEIEKEVNIGRNFAPLRQIYQALILAKWYKETIQNSLIDAVYTNKRKIAGINLRDPSVKQQIYQRYLRAYKKGAFNYIKEDPAPDGQVVPRKYFSGGTNFENIMEVIVNNPANVTGPDGAMISITVAMRAVNAMRADTAMMSSMALPLINLGAAAGTVLAWHVIKTAAKKNQVSQSNLYPKSQQILPQINPIVSFETFKRQTRLFFPKITEKELKRYFEQLSNTLRPGQYVYLLFDRTMDSHPRLQLEIRKGFIKDWRVDHVEINILIGNVIKAEYKNKAGAIIFIEFYAEEVIKTGDIVYFNQVPHYSIGSIVPHIDLPMATPKPPDRTMTLPKDTYQPVKNGGIDLNQINVNRTGEKVNVQFDQAQIKTIAQGSFAGFTPVIISITPVQNPLPLLGINQSGQGNHPSI